MNNIIGSPFGVSTAIQTALNNIGEEIAESRELYLSNYDSFNGAVSAVSSLGKSLIIDQPIDLGGANVDCLGVGLVWLSEGNLISNGTVNINGCHITAGRFKIFNDDVTLLGTPDLTPVEEFEPSSKEYTDTKVSLIGNQVSDLQAFLGYTDDDIMGLEVDFENKTFTRLAGAVNRTPGEMFDNVQAFGGRRRCNITDDGKVLAYHGEAAYTETGKLTQAITLGEETYPIGHQVQVMVEQPKFYYRVIPLKLEKAEKGFHNRKARYYVSDVKKDGFKLHPAFIHDGKENNFIYLSAYEGSVFDVSADAYLLADEQIADFTATTGDKLSSIGNAKPASGLTQNLTRANTRILAQNRGTGWFQPYAATVSATQLLFLIEYASFNTQSKIGEGVMKTDDGLTNMAELTGATTNLGNTSGEVVNGSVTYRGEENFWGNIWKWIDGLNIEAKGLHNLYVADHGFADDIGVDPYKDAGITLSKSSGYVSAFAYNEEFDWLFFASETAGDSALPIGDNFYQNYTYDGWLVALLGGSWYHGSNAGGFYWSVGAASSFRSRSLGGRLVYVPNVA
jgi:hypothetical protein